jgi:cell wall-associated NlpC family hydrolase
LRKNAELSEKYVNLALGNVSMPGSPGPAAGSPAAGGAGRAAKPRARRPESAGEPRVERGVQLTTHPLRRNVAAATTVCCIVCTVVGGALISGNSQAGPPVSRPAAAAGTGEADLQFQADIRRADALPLFLTTAQFPEDEWYADRLVELRGANRSLLPVGNVDPAPPGGTAGTAPGTEAGARAESSGFRSVRGAGAGRAGRGADAQRRSSRAGRAGRSRPRTAANRPPRRLHDRGARRPPRPGGPALAAGYTAGYGGIVGFAMAQVGKEYAFGSTGPDAFDCSGLVVAAYRLIGIALPRSTGGLSTWGRPVARDELRPGDLVFPTSGHVGIYIGNGRIVHASTKRGGVKVSSIYAFSFARRVVG